MHYSEPHGKGHSMNLCGLSNRQCAPCLRIHTPQNKAHYRPKKHQALETMWSISWIQDIYPFLFFPIWVFTPSFSSLFYSFYLSFSICVEIETICNRCRLQCYTSGKIKEQQSGRIAHVQLHLTDHGQVERKNSVSYLGRELIVSVSFRTRVYANPKRLDKIR